MRRLAVLGTLLAALAITATDAASSFGATTSLSAVPAGFQPQSVDALNASDWWISGSDPCTSGSCDAIIHTDNGGKSFTAIGSPPSSFAEAQFADPEDGYAFGPGLWSTHDGGRSWAQLRIGTGVNPVVVGGGYAYALVSRGGKPSLMRSAVTSDHWITLRRGGPVMWSLLAQGETLMVQAGSRVLISHDDGEDLVVGGALPSNSECEFQATGFVTLIWGECVQSRAGATGELIRSRDGGLSWMQVTVPVKGLINAFGAASSNTVVVEQQKLERTADAGISWSGVKAAGPAGGWSQLEFLSPTMGLAIGNFRNGGSGSDGVDLWRLYKTTDAGLSYHRLTL